MWFYSVDYALVFVILSGVAWSTHQLATGFSQVAFCVLCEALIVLGHMLALREHWGIYSPILFCCFSIK